MNIQNEKNFLLPKDKSNRIVMSKKPKENYIDNAKFLEEIKLHKARVKAHKEAGKNTPPPPINNYIGECILKIAQRMAYRPEFIRYSFVEDMILDAVENALTYFDNFNPDHVGDRSGIVTPFGYFSQITYYAFQRRILKEQKYRYVKNKALEQVLLSVDGETLEEYNPTVNVKVAETAALFIERYEAREKSKKIKREEKKARANVKIQE
jgi:hypothetical protein